MCHIFYCQNNIIRIYKEKKKLNNSSFFYLNKSLMPLLSSLAQRDSCTFGISDRAGIVRSVSPGQVSQEMPAGTQSIAKEDPYSPTKKTWKCTDVRSMNCVLEGPWAQLDKAQNRGEEYIFHPLLTREGVTGRGPVYHLLFQIILWSKIPSEPSLP